MKKKKKNAPKFLPLTKLLFLVFLILSVLAIYIFIQKNQHTSFKENSPEPTKKECDLDVCPYMNVATIKGYYNLYDNTDMEGNPIQCDSILVKQGTPELIQGFRLKKEANNGLNNINDKNELMISIDIENLSSENREKILNSNENNIIALKVQHKVVKGMGVPACFSLIDILDVM